MLRKLYFAVLTILFAAVCFGRSETCLPLLAPLLFGTIDKLKKFQTLDLYLAAWLAMNGHSPTYARQGTRIVFEFPATDEVYKIAASYNGNPDIALLDFVSEVRKVRAQMLSARG